MKKKYLFIFFISFFILWHPIHVYLFPYDGKNRLLFAIACIFLFIGFTKINKKFIKKGRFYDLPFFLWVIWVNINTFLFNPVNNPNIENAFEFIQLTVLPFIIYFGIRLNFINVNVKKQWRWFFFSLILFLTLVLLFGSVNSETGRLGEYVNSNEIAWVALLTLFSSFIVIRKGYLEAIVVMLVLMLIIITASKKALLSFIFFFLIKYLIVGNASIIKRISIVVVFSIILGLVTPILIENTYVGERIQSSIEKNQNADDDSELFDGRANFYIKGMEFLNDRPLIGIGLTNFLVLGKMEEEAHSEYVVQFAELGIIGLVLFLIFHFRVFTKLVYLYRSQRNNEIYSILLVSFLTFYGMFLGRWVYDNIPYTIFLALTINTIVSYNKRIKIKST